MANQNALLTVTQAAKRLGVSPNTVRAWADGGVIPVLRLPSGHRRFEASALDAARSRMVGRGNGESSPGMDRSRDDGRRREIGRERTDEQWAEVAKNTEEMFRFADAIAAQHRGSNDSDSVGTIRAMRYERRLTAEEVERGLHALAEMERMAKLFEAKYGPYTPESWQLLDEARNERERQLTGLS
jgi:excisionase family DNA binding protein